MFEIIKYFFKVFDKYGKFLTNHSADSLFLGTLEL